MTIDISGLNKADVLSALYEYAKPLGLGFFEYVPGPLPENEAQRFVSQNPGYLYFDYLKGRLMKVNITGDSFEERLFDRDNGTGMAAAAIADLRAKKST